MTPEQLKASILQYAIQGKLVEQRPEEGTGEELFQQIQAEKQRLIKEGKIKKEKPFSQNPAYQDYPFDIPDTWMFVRFGELLITRDSERIPVSVSDRNKRAKIYDYYGASGVIDKIDDFLFDKELLLIGEDGANLLSRSTPIAFIAKGKYWVNNHAHVLDACCNLDLDYVCYYINAISLAPYVTGTAQPKMNQENMNAIWIALPPLAEQKRIVAKIEELLPYVDCYAAAYEKLEQFNAKFPEDMKKSILQYAIQGKLVEQRPEEGTGEDIFKQLKPYHKGIKPCKDELNFSSMDFDIPESWTMVELNQIFDFVDYRGKTPTKITSGVFLITASNIKQGYMDYTRKEYISFEEYKGRQSRGLTQNGDLLFTTEAPMGNAALCDLDECSCGQRIITFKEYTKEATLPALFMYFILSPQFQQQLLDNCTGTTAKGIKAEKLKHFLLPLPPYEEQKRIVAKLEEILPLCERLK